MAGERISIEEWEARSERALERHETRGLVVDLTSASSRRISRFLAISDNHNVLPGFDLTGIELDRLGFQDKVFVGPVYLSGANVPGGMSFTRCEFEQGFDARAAEAGGRSDFRGTQFSDTAGFEDSSFEIVDFSHADFKGYSRFGGMSSDHSYFDEVTWRHPPSGLDAANPSEGSLQAEAEHVLSHKGQVSFAALTALAAVIGGLLALGIGGQSVWARWSYLYATVLGALGLMMAAALALAPASRRLSRFRGNPYMILAVAGGALVLIAGLGIDLVGRADQRATQAFFADSEPDGQSSGSLAETAPIGTVSVEIGDLVLPPIGIGSTIEGPAANTNDAGEGLLRFVVEAIADPELLAVVLDQFGEGVSGGVGISTELADSLLENVVNPLIDGGLDIAQDQLSGAVLGDDALLQLVELMEEERGLSELQESERLLLAILLERSLTELSSSNQTVSPSFDQASVTVFIVNEADGTTTVMSVPD